MALSIVQDVSKHVSTRRNSFSERSACSPDAIRERCNWRHTLFIAPHCMGALLPSSSQRDCCARSSWKDGRSLAELRFVGDCNGGGSQGAGSRNQGGSYVLTILGG